MNQFELPFPQEERLLENEFSINLPAEYNLKGKIRKSWINIINPLRSLLVVGSPGSGKSYFVIRHVITMRPWKKRLVLTARYLVSGRSTMVLFNVITSK